MEENDQVNNQVNNQALDLDGDGKISPWESNLCRVCLLAAIVLAFGDNAVQFIS